MSRARILLADDHRLVAEGLRSLLEPEFDLVAIVEDGQQLVAAAKTHDPDVIVADITMPLLNGLEAIEQIHKQNSRAKVLFLTMHNDASYAARALKSGAAGYILKHSAPAELVTALRMILAGDTYISDSLKLDTERSSLVETALQEPFLTPRQREVLQLVSAGKTAREIGAILHISTRTAENHKARIMRVLGVATTADLIRFAIRRGIIMED